MARFGRGYIQRPLYVKHRQSIYPQSLSAMTAQADMSASIFQKSNKFLSATIAPSDSKLLFFFYKILIASFLSTHLFASAIKQSQNKFNGLVTSSNLLTNLINKLLSSNIVLNGLLIKNISNIFISNITKGSSLINSVYKINIGVLLDSGNILKQSQLILSSNFGIFAIGAVIINKIGKIFESVFSGSTIITASIGKNANRIMTSSSPVSGSLNKNINKLLSSVLQSQGALINKINKILSSSIDSVGSIVNTLQYYLNLFGDISSQGNINKLINKVTFAFIVSNSINIKNINIYPTSILNNIGSLNISRFFNRIFSGATNLTAITNLNSRKVFTGTLSSSSNIIKFFNKKLTAISVSTGQVLKNISFSLSSSQLLTGIFSSQKFIFNPAILKEIIVSIIDFTINTFITTRATSSIEDMSITTSIIENNQTQIQDMSISTEIVDNTTAQLYQERG